MARALFLIAGLMSVAGCTGGGSAPDGRSDTDDPMCPVIDFETVCAEHGFPHVAQRWRFPEGSPGVGGSGAGITVDGETPPVDDLGNVPRLQTTWCASDPERPQDSEGLDETTPSPALESLGAWWTDGGTVGQQVYVRILRSEGGWESRKCFDLSQPVIEVSLFDVAGERTERIEYPWNIPSGWEQCWPEPTDDQLRCPAG